ncbi:MAG: NADP-dependent isocitrate dehydrogenase [Phycisphaerales bacterium]
MSGSSASATASTPATAAGPPVPITVAAGDGIGPEIMKATLSIIQAAGASLDIDTIEIGESVYLGGHSAGITDDSWDSLRRTGVFLKAPITTPSGGGYKSLNVTVRKTLGLYANVRPCRSYDPAVSSRFPKMDIVIIRENEEDTYAGIEHRQTREVTQCLKLMTRPGSERCIRYGFEFAKAHGRDHVTCMVKDNIHKITDGMFAEVFETVAKEYPDIRSERMIVDIGAARVADTPEQFDVVICPNLYGDILSDIAAQISGSVGLVGTSNIGATCAMFEAVHGSAPDIAGKGIANPSGLLLGAVQMLTHIGQRGVAARVHNAWLRTIEDGIHTGDIYREGSSKERVGTADFAAAVVERVGQRPEQLAAVPEPSEDDATSGGPIRIDLTPPAHREKKELIGVDVFVDWEGDDRDANVLAAQLNEAAPGGMKLVMVSNRGVKVWPDGLPETFCVDHWRCRFRGVNAGGELGAVVEPMDVVRLQQAIIGQGLDVIKTENLYQFDGERGYALGQGE